MKETGALATGGLIEGRDKRGGGVDNHAALVQGKELWRPGQRARTSRRLPDFIGVGDRLDCTWGGVDEERKNSTKSPRVPKREGQDGERPLFFQILCFFNSFLPLF